MRRRLQHGYSSKKREVHEEVASRGEKLREEEAPRVKGSKRGKLQDKKARKRKASRGESTNRRNLQEERSIKSKELRMEEAPREGSPKMWKLQEKKAPRG